MDDTANHATAIDILAPTTQHDVFGLYARLRRDRPVCRLAPGDLWGIARYADVKAALQAPQLFSSAGYRTVFQPDWLAPDCRRDPFILGEDPPEHTRDRALVNKAFVPRVIRPLEPLMQETAARLAAALRQAGGGEFLHAFAFPYVMTVIRRITGTEDQDPAQLRHWVELAETLGPVEPSAAEIAAIEDAIRVQNRFFDEVIADRQRCPRADLASALTQARVDGARLGPLQLRSQLDLLVGAGLGTTVYMLANAMMLLARTPALLNLLRADPARLPAFIEEMLRFNGPTHGLLRTTTGPVRLHGTSIPAGATVLLLIAAANRDPAQFPDPDRFDLERANAGSHVAFGQGPHTCIGAALARVELRIALEALLEHCTALACPPDEELTWLRALNSHAVERLPLRVA